MLAVEAANGAVDALARPLDVKKMKDLAFRQSGVSDHGFSFRFDAGPSVTRLRYSNSGRSWRGKEGILAAF